MPTVYDVLSSKDSGMLHIISPAASVLDAVHKMNDMKIGALIVMEDQQVQGIFTERDVLRRVIGEGRKPSTTTVNEVMTRELVCVEPATDIDDVSTLMKTHRIRHLPVCNADGKLIGMVSIGDVNAFHTSNQQATLHYLSEYIYGRV